jgi:branched-chain amino acid transport system substrate-binding protein
MPKVARYLKGHRQGQERRDHLGQQRLRQGRPRHDEKALVRRASRSRRRYRPTRVRLDFSGAVLASEANADALFVYTNEEESARALRELRKQVLTNRSSVRRCSRVRR